jgi:uncharacterized protein (DUF488 family)
MKNAIYTIGHSTRTIEEFIEILKTYGIETLVDVRKIAGSRRNPQYGEKVLSANLGGEGIAYLRLEGLGGRRRTSDESVNTGWRNLSFRGYADHMQSAEFKTSLDELIAVGASKQTVIMCAEAVPWRCHRSLIGDALLVRGVEVMDIFDAKNCKPHKLTPFARVDGERITYPSDEAKEVMSDES